jgi:hypothetical protein
MLVVTPGCGGAGAPAGGAPAGATQFNPGIIAMPHVSYDPSTADQVARGASYSAWIDLADETTLDLAVWSSRLAATRALRQYRAGGPKTYPDRGVLGTGFPFRVRKIERLKNVTLAWYRRPSKADENEVRHALRFHTARGLPRIYTALWAIPGTTIDPDPTAGTTAAAYSASLSGGAIGGPLTVAIWPSVRAALSYIDGLRGLQKGGLLPDVEWRQLRNVTIDTAASFGSRTHISDADVRAIRPALH